MSRLVFNKLVAVLRARDDAASSWHSLWKEAQGKAASFKHASMAMAFYQHCITRGLNTQRTKYTDFTAVLGSLDSSVERIVGKQFVIEEEKIQRWIKVLNSYGSAVGGRPLAR